MEVQLRFQCHVKGCFAFIVVLLEQSGELRGGGRGGVTLRTIHAYIYASAYAVPETYFAIPRSGRLSFVVAMALQKNLQHVYDSCMQSVS